MQHQRVRAASREQRRFYDAAYAPNRPRIREGMFHAAVRLFELHRSEAVFRLMPKGGRLLDVGCADGAFALRCAPYFDRVLGVDLVEEQVRAAHRRASLARLRHAAFLVANLDEGLPVGADQFNVVTGIAVLAMVLDPIAVVREFHRVLKPGGYLILELPNLAYLPRRLTLLAGGLPSVSAGYGWDGGHLHNFTLSAVRKLLAEHGLHLERTTGSGVLASARAWRPSLLTGNLIVFSRKV